MSLYPTVLENEYVSLRPMHIEHTLALHAAGKDSAIWQWTTHPYCLTLELTQQWVKTCLDNAAKHTQYPFVIVANATQQIVGATSYLNIAPLHKAIEIGYTFLSPTAQRTHINRNCKMLLLSHAFETHGYQRVALQTHEKNAVSRAAILGIGAKFEGIQRNCRIQHDGSTRSSAIYSIIRQEWPSVKAKLAQSLLPR